MAGAAGFEPKATDSEGVENQQEANSPVQGCTQIGAQISGEDRQDLARLVAHWGSIPKQLKEAILAILELAERGGK